MPIKVGDRLPDTKFRVMTTEGPVWKTTDEVFKGRKVALFAVPGAFTPTCNNLHIPSFLNNAAAIKAKGVHTIAVTGVNDVFVMEAWKKSTARKERSIFLLTATATLPRRSTWLSTDRATALAPAPSAIRCLSTMAW